MPKVELEQYCIDATSTVDIAYFAGFEFHDIENNVLFDLGAGTGRISIASAFFRPKIVISVDIDPLALLILKKNIQNLEVKSLIHPLCTDISFIDFSRWKFLNQSKVTTIMNPPFGVQKNKADRNFLALAFKISDIIYSIHLTNKKVHNFIKSYSSQFNWKIDYSLPFNMILERSFSFHTKKRKQIDVTIYRFVKNY